MPSTNFKVGVWFLEKKTARPWPCRPCRLLRPCIITYKDTNRYTNLNITLLINNTDPILLEFIRQLTCTVREGGRRLFDAQETEASDAKKIRHFYILCVLLFNANHACSAPLHVLLTETSLCQGGDQVLVQIMNRIGAVASLDTSNRLATHVVQTRLVKGIKPSLIPNALMIVSVDILIYCNHML